jgi:hypothetical protein
MSKYLNIPNGDYKVKVQNGGSITLDTGYEEGTVYVTGNLVVQGNTTTIQSEDLTVRDNIIVVNSGETGSGITLDIAGIRFDRGVLSDGYFLFDENITWRDPITDTTKTGVFVFRNKSSALVGIRTNSISTGGGDLFLINAGTGVISVEGTNNYESTVVDDDHITNKKYVDDAISTAFALSDIKQIGDGTVTPTTVKAIDFETSSSESRIEIAVDNTVVANIYKNRFEFSDVRIIGTKIETLTSDTDLILSSPGTGHIRIEDTLQINSVPNSNDVAVAPTAPLNGLKIYVSDQSTGGSGLFFVNAEQTRDEVISNNRSLVYSMIF